MMASTCVCGQRGMLVLALPVVRGRPMSIETQLREKLRKIEALFAGAARPVNGLPPRQRAGVRARPSGAAWATGSADRDAILYARSLVEAFFSRSLSALWIGAGRRRRRGWW